MVFIFLGIGMLIGAGYLIQNTQQFMKIAQQTQGVVVDLQMSSTSGSNGTSYSYYPIVEFKAFDQSKIKFKSNFGTNPPMYHRGEWVEVLYDPDNPHRAKIHSYFGIWFPCYILVFVGGVFALVGISILGYFLYQKRQKEWLNQFGRSIYPQIIEIQKNTNARVNRKPTYRLIAQWNNPTDGKIYDLKSHRISEDLNLMFRVGDSILVKIDPNNFKKYDFDLKKGTVNGP